MIKGLTDRGMAFPEIGSVRKGAKKTDANRPGSDLKYFRVEFDEREQEAQKIFFAKYGAQPTEINILLPFNEIEKVWDAWYEAYTAGRMVARSDGEHILYMLDASSGEVKVLGGEPQTPHPANGIVGYYTDSRGSRQPIKLRPVGRLKIVIPELKRLAYLTVHTTSIHDIINISSQLEAIRVMNGGRIAGIPLVLRRRPKMISTPSQDGSRVRREKWLLSIEADPAWVKAKLLEMKQSALPGNGLALLPEGENVPLQELPEACDEDEDENNIDAEYIEDEPLPEPKPEEKEPGGRPLSPEALRESLAKAAAQANPGQFYEADRQHVAACLEYVFMSRDKRHMFIRWLTDGATESMKDLAPSMVLALKRWLKPFYNENATAFIPADKFAPAEANEALKEFLRQSGQMEFDIS